jgi:uncharacterized protein with PIN domain
MPKATVRFYAGLNDFLPSGKQYSDIHVIFQCRTSLKHIIESIGVPHTEIDLVLVNGTSVDFAFQPNESDRISVYPVFERFDISSLIKLHPPPQRPTRFILDTHLGKLSSYLRLLGFDSIYSNNMDDDLLAEKSCDENRILLTRDIGLLKRSKVTHGYFVRSTHPKQQVVEVVRYFNLGPKITPFSRCLKCNELLHAIDKKEIWDSLKPDTRKHFNDFQICTQCERIFWEGSHFERMNNFVQDILDRVK